MGVHDYLDKYGDGENNRRVVVPDTHRYHLDIRQCPGCWCISLLPYAKVTWGVTSPVSDFWRCFVCELRVHFGRDRVWRADPVHDMGFIATKRGTLFDPRGTVQ